MIQKLDQYVQNKCDRDKMAGRAPRPVKGCVTVNVSSTSHLLVGDGGCLLASLEAASRMKICTYTACLLLSPTYPIPAS